MLRFLFSLPILALVLTTPAVSQSEKKDTKVTKLEKGKDLPGPFNPYNATGPRAGRYHCLVTQTSLDPMVIIFVRDADFTDSLQALEVELDNRIAKNPNVRLGSFTVVVSDELAKVVEDDDKRDELAAKLAAQAKAKDLKHVVLCLDSKSDLENYGLDDNAWVTVVLVNQYKVVSVRTLSKDQLNSEKVAEIIGEVSAQLGARRK
jgi:ribosomal protein L3